MKIDIEAISETDAYYIALLVHKGWERVWGGEWKHPEGKRYQKEEERGWDSKKIIDEEYWPFDAACDEVES